MRSFIIIFGTIINLQSGHEYVVEMAVFDVQRAITPKIGKPVLQFMCSACPLILLYICVKFHENIEQTPVHSRNYYIQRAATPKVG